MTEKTKNIYQKLLDVMQEVRYIEKEKKTVNNQYRFVSHDAVTAATSEAFIKHGIYAKPKIVKNEITTIEVERYNKYEKVTIKETNFVCSVEVEYDFINVENPEDRICGVNGLGQGIDSQDKACGKAISYACKYALLKALGIETGDEPEKDVDFNIASKPKGNDRGFMKEKPSNSIADDQGMQELKGQKKEMSLADKKKRAEDFFTKTKMQLELCENLEQVQALEKENEVAIKGLNKPEYGSLYSTLLEAIDYVKLGFVGE